MELIIGIVLLVFAVFLVVAVLMQSGKSHNLSGTIAGGAETFFGKEKGKSMDKKLNRATTIAAIAFVLVVIILYVVNHEKDINPDDVFKDEFNTPDTTTAVTTAAPDTTDADDTTGAEDTTDAEDTTGAGDTTASGDVDAEPEA